jgi:hypothetical protein
MEIPTRTINSFDDIIKIGTTLGKNWYRGHSKIYNNLIPRIFRKREFVMDFLMEKETEQKNIENFKRYAPSLNIKLPPQDDTLQWLFIMQHHGFATRLLDWTESILIATFFAVIDHQNEDGEVFTIFPQELNIIHGFNGFPLPQNKILKFLANEPLHNKPKELASELGLSEVPKFPMAFLPPLSLPRMTAQLSAFTIHPTKLKSNGIENVLHENKQIARYIIPKNLKSKFETNLAYLGISYRTLFPDLEGLASAFQKEERFYAWGQPDPPLFK